LLVRCVHDNRHIGSRLSGCWTCPARNSKGRVHRGNQSRSHSSIFGGRSRHSRQCRIDPPRNRRTPTQTGLARQRRLAPAISALRGVADTQFSRFISIVNIIQFDTMSRVLGWQSRYRWILRPGNDLYVVYTHNWVEGPLVDRFATLDRRAASKVLYTHRF